MVKGRVTVIFIVMLIKFINFLLTVLSGTSNLESKIAESEVKKSSAITWSSSLSLLLSSST